MKHLVVGVDGSASSEMAVHWASALASATGAGITVAHVVDLTNREDEPGRGVVTEAKHAEWVQKLDTTRIEHDSRLLHGDPPSRILDLAMEVGADMIVIGRRGHALLAPRLLGSFTRRLLQTNEIPVAVVPAPAELAPRHTLAPTAVVGLDGTVSSRSVLTFAACFSDALGLRLEALTVVDIHGDPTPGGTRSGRLVGSAERTLRRLLHAVDPRCRHRIAVHTEVGVPSDQLLRRSSDAEVLVVGHRRTTPIGRFLTHATSRYCAAHAVCPIVMVPIEPIPIGGSTVAISDDFWQPAAHSETEPEHCAQTH